MVTSDDLSTVVTLKAHNFGSGLSEATIIISMNSFNLSSHQCHL